MAYPISPTPVQCALNPCLTGCPEVTHWQQVQPWTHCQYLCNRSFECPVILNPVDSINGDAQTDLVKCWAATGYNPKIELWKNTGNAGPLPHSGNQYTKLVVSVGLVGPTRHKLHQTTILPIGVPLVISFWHAGRVGFMNNMTVSLGRDNSSIPLGNVGSINDPNPIILGNFTAVDNVWTQHVINITLTPGFNSVFSLIFQSNDPTNGGGGNFIDDVSISRVVPALTSSSNSPVVLGNTINLTSSTIAAHTYSWVGPNGFTSPLQNPIISNATALDGGVYTVTATPISNIGCPAVSSTTVVILPCDISVIASSNSPVIIGDVLNLTSTPSGVAPYTFLWTGPNGYSSANQNPFFTVTSLVEGGTYTVQITDSNNCIALADIDIEVISPPCFLITDCDTTNPQPPFTTSTDLIIYDGKIVKFCDAIPAWAPGCYCATITRTMSCLVTTPLPTFISSIIDEFVTCITCHPYCYLLTDCSDPLNTIIVSNDFVNYIGLVVKLEGCSTCWEVSQLINCTGAVCGDPVVTDENSIAITYTTCVECLPPVLPIPKEELALRSVKPGYNTPGCSPEYTEKINCNFAEAAYDQMAISRYGIDICCDLDLDILDIKKQELDLRAIYDPNLCETIVPECTTCNDCPPITCITDLDCTGGQVCVNGICVDP